MPQDNNIPSNMVKREYYKINGADDLMIKESGRYPIYERGSLIDIAVVSKELKAMANNDAYLCLEKERLPDGSYRIVRRYRVEKVIRIISKDTPVHIAEVPPLITDTGDMIESAMVNKKVSDSNSPTVALATAAYEQLKSDVDKMKKDRKVVRLSSK